MLGVGNLISSIIGDEITTASWGHFGAFPLPARSGTRRPGRSAGPRPHAQSHLRGGTHPCAGRGHRRAPPHIDPTCGYFIIGEFDPHSDRAGKKGFSFDFDAIEVLNGYQDPARRSVDRMIDDYLGLLNHGHLATATGNSDTHHLTYNMGGYPRNYLRVPDDRIGHVTPQDVAQAVKAHTSSSPPSLVRMHAGQADIGDLVATPGGHARVDIEVDAAPWVSVDDSRDPLRERQGSPAWTVPPSQRWRAFAPLTKLTLAADGYALVRVDGNELLAPVVGDRKTFGVYPLALSKSHLLRREQQRPLRPRLQTRATLRSRAAAVKNTRQRPKHASSTLPCTSQWEKRRGVRRRGRLAQHTLHHIDRLVERVHQRPYRGARHLGIHESQAQVADRDTAWPKRQTQTLEVARQRRLEAA